MGGKPKTGKRPIQSRFLTLGKLALLAGILAAVFFFSAILGMRFAVRGRVLETPQLVGMSMRDAEALFLRVELNLVVAGRRYDPTHPEGVIISQVPGPGLGVKARGDVRVVVSMGRRTNPVPDLRNTSIRAARLMAEQNRYQLGRISEIRLGAGDDRIIAQFPRPKAEEALSDQIDVLVQKENRRAYIMPDVVGWNLNRVLQFFEKNRFEVKGIRYRRYSGISRGSVVRQFPEPGYALKEGEPVNLEVAR